MTDRDTASTGNETWTLEWNKKQNAFHVQLLATTLKSSRDAFSGNRESAWIVLAVGTRAEIELLADQLRPLLHTRDIIRQAEGDV